MMIVPMREVNLRSVDLNLLTVLQVLLEERHVTRAAERLNMSQSAVSRALQRLRVLFHDPLLVKSAQGYSLSKRADKLAAELDMALKSVTRLIQEPEFDPLRVEATIKFAGIDLDSWIDMPELMAKFLSQAPNLNIDVSYMPADYFDMLAKGDVDYVVTGIGPSKHLGDIHRSLLGESDLIVLMGENNPLAAQTLDFKKYLAAVHGFVTITGKGPTYLDNYLSSIGMKRHVALKISDFRSVIDYVEKSDILFMLPRALIMPLTKGRKVVLKPLPKEIKMPKVNFYLYWHSRFHQDPLHLWIKQKLLSTRRLSD